MRHATSYHTPVMVEEVLRYLEPARGGMYLDGTLGGGGHAEALLMAAPAVQVIGVDRDPDARAESAARLAAFGDRVRIVAGSFSDAVEAAGVAPGTLSGVLLDLGISSHQIDEAGRGFTFRPGAPLDMRMSRQSAGGPSAADLLNTLELDDLAHIFRTYGEERRAGHLARIIGEMRERESFARSEHLVEAIGRALPGAGPQDRARIFQALRIEVNAEVEVLTSALPRLRDALRSGGVMVVLSYHSLEDRVVKDAFREWSRACICPPRLPICQCRGEPLGETLTRKPLMASEAEISANARARSARLRAWRRA